MRSNYFNDLLIGFSYLLPFVNLSYALILKTFFNKTDLGSSDAFYSILKTYFFYQTIGTGMVINLTKHRLKLKAFILSYFTTIFIGNTCLLIAQAYSAEAFVFRAMRLGGFSEQAQYWVVFASTISVPLLCCGRYNSNLRGVNFYVLRCMEASGPTGGLIYLLYQNIFSIQYNPIQHFAGGIIFEIIVYGSYNFYCLITPIEDQEDEIYSLIEEKRFIEILTTLIPLGLRRTGILVSRILMLITVKTIIFDSNQLSLIEDLLPLAMIWVDPIEGDLFLNIFKINMFPSLGEKLEFIETVITDLNRTYIYFIQKTIVKLILLVVYYKNYINGNMIPVLIMTTITIYINQTIFWSYWILYNITPKRGTLILITTIGVGLKLASYLLYVVIANYFMEHYSERVALVFATIINLFSSGITIAYMSYFCLEFDDDWKNPHNLIKIPVFCSYNIYT